MPGSVRGVLGNRHFYRDRIDRWRPELEDLENFRISDPLIALVGQKWCEGSSAERGENLRLASSSQAGRMAACGRFLPVRP